MYQTATIQGLDFDSDMVEDLLCEALTDNNERVTALCKKALDGDRGAFLRICNSILKPRIIKVALDDLYLEAGIC